MDLFHKLKTSKDGHGGWCKACFKVRYDKNRISILAKLKAKSAANRPAKKIYDKEYNIKNAARVRRNRRLFNLKDRYGVSGEDYDHMYASQNGVCYICKNPEPNKTRHLAVDHCHATGMVRRLLCTHCNLGLGAFKDNVELLFEGIKYLKQFGK